MKWLLALLDQRFGPIRFVQVGAHDGSSKSPLSGWRQDGRWTGLMVEPVPYLFAKLKSRFEDVPGMIVENVAIGTQRGESTFFAMRPMANPPLEQYDMLGSFRKDVILKHAELLPGIESYIVELRVQTWPLMDLVRRHGLDDAQALVLDTEGYDYEILQTVDFKTFKPKLVIYEYKHLNDEQRRDASKLLASEGYYVMRANDEDAVGVHPDLVPAAECEIIVRPLLEHDSLMRLFEKAGTFTVMQKPSGGLQVRRAA